MRVSALAPSASALANRENVLLAIGAVVAVALRAILVPMLDAWGDLDQYAAWVHALATDLPSGAAHRLQRGSRW